MDESQPKRRGRKKKIQGEAFPAVNIPLEKHSSPLIVDAIEDVTNKTVKISKEQIQSKLIEASNFLENAIKPDNLVEAMQERIIKRIAGRFVNGDGCFMQRLKTTYKHVKDSCASANEKLEWENQISFNMARRICKCLDFILQNGPTNKIEAKILDECSSALQSYYIERSHLLNVNFVFYSESTYYPDEKSCIYRYLIEVLNIPSLNNLHTFCTNIKEDK